MAVSLYLRMNNLLTYKLRQRKCYVLSVFLFFYKASEYLNFGPTGFYHLYLNITDFSAYKIKHIAYI